MNVARIKTHLLNWREWELNPIVLKELRQSVRSWAVTGMLLLFLLVLFVVSMGFIVTQSFAVGGDDQLGGNLFGAFLIVLAGAGIVFIPLYTGLRVAAERQDNNPDLLYISTLSPGRIIRGKFFCGAYVALLFFSACLPFMALTNLMRGVDLPTVSFLLVFLYIVVCGVNLAAIFIACLPITKIFKIVLGLAGFILLCGVLSGAMTLAFEMMRSGVGEMLFQRQFWHGALAFLFLAGGAAGLFYVLSVALISPLSANRALVPRIYLTLFWLLSGLVATYAATKTSAEYPLLMWAFYNSISLVLALIVTVSNHDRLSVRVRRKIPRNGPARLLAFCFYNGAAGGLVWVAGLTLLTYGGLRICWNILPMLASDDFSKAFPPMALYFFAYALFALFIHRTFLSRFALKITGILAVFLTAITALGTNIVLFFMNKLSWQAAEHLELGNAFNVIGEHDEVQRTEHLGFALLLVVVALAVNAKWFFTQWKNFVPPAEKMTPPKLD